MGELGAIDRLNLKEIAQQHREAYRTASPWPHVVIDGLFDPAVVARAREEELGPALELAVHRSTRTVKAESPAPAGPTARNILHRLLDADVCDLLTSLTGIPELVVDPAHWWAGVHVMAPGSFQAVHRDFPRYGTDSLWHRMYRWAGVHGLAPGSFQPVNRDFGRRTAGGLWHRVNVLVYLNPAWRSEWGGQLELWDPAMTACHRSIEPVGGRMVVFESTPDALHGIPDAVRCPAGDARLTLASYYYTADAGPHAGRRHSKAFGLPRRPGEGVLTSVAIPFDAPGWIRKRVSAVVRSGR